MTTSNVTAVIQCNIHKVWETVSAVERYDAWRSDVSKIEVTDEKQFIEYTKDGYATAKQLGVRPVGKSVFEQTYLKKEQTRFVGDLKKVIG